MYTSSSNYTVENDSGFWDFLNPDNYYAEIDGERYLANSYETVGDKDFWGDDNWTSFDKSFLNTTLDSLVGNANEKETNWNRIMTKSIGRDLDFKRQLPKDKLYLANGVLYNKNEAGNFVWSYFLNSKGYSSPIDGILAQGGSIVGSKRLDESWDVRARHAGTMYYYSRNFQNQYSNFLIEGQSYIDSLKGW